MVNKMLNHGAGSLAGWRTACKIMKASMDYVVFGTMERAGEDFTALLNANREMGKAVESLRKERDQLVEQIQKLQMIQR